MRVTNIKLTSLDTLKNVSAKVFLKLLFETRVVHDMRYTLKITIAEVSGIQSRIYRIRVKIYLLTLYLKN